MSVVGVATCAQRREFSSSCQQAAYDAASDRRAPDPARDDGGNGEAREEREEEEGQNPHLDPLSLGENVLSPLEHAPSKEHLHARIRHQRMDKRQGVRKGKGVPRKHGLVGEHNPSRADDVEETIQSGWRDHGGHYRARGRLDSYGTAPNAVAMPAPLYPNTMPDSGRQRLECTLWYATNL